MAALLLCLCAVSHAQEIAPVLQTRISLLLPAGMEEAEGSPEKKDGSIHLIIDSRATGWNRVALQSYSPDSIEAVVAVQGPEGAAYYHYDAGNEGSDEEILSRLEDADPQDAYEGDQVQNGTVVARMLKDYNTVVPEKAEDSAMTLYVRWYNENYQEILTEKVAFTCEHTVPGGVYAVLSEIPASLIGVQTGDGISPEVKNGQVTYTLSREPEKKERLTTRVYLPEGASECRLVSFYDGDEDLSVLQEGARLYVELQTRFPASGAPLERFRLEFLDEDGNIVSGGVLAIQHITQDAAPWPVYVQEWSAVPAESLILSFDGSTGVSMPYQDGILSYDFSQIVSDPEALDGSQVTVSVLPPDDAMYLRYNCMGGGEGLLGPSDAEDLEDVHSGMAEWGELFALSKGSPVQVGEWGVLSAVHTYDGVTLFIPTVPTELDAGLAYLFFWYDSEGAMLSNQPDTVWWFVETCEPYVKEILEDVIETEDDVPDNYEGAVVIGMEGSDLKTATWFYLQQGENARHYDIHVQDIHGNPIKDGKMKTVYLPYPPGHFYGDGHTYELRHYLQGSEYEMIAELDPKPKGLRFQTRDFSPFVLHWNDAGVLPPADGNIPETGGGTGWQPENLPGGVPENSAAAQIPQTGDEGFPSLWSLMILLGVLGVTAFKRKSA